MHPSFRGYWALTTTNDDDGDDAHHDDDVDECDDNDGDSDGVCLMLR